MLLLTVTGPQAKHGFSGRDSKVAHPEIRRVTARLTRGTRATRYRYSTGTTKFLHSQERSVKIMPAQVAGRLGHPDDREECKTRIFQAKSLGV